MFKNLRSKLAALISSEEVAAAPQQRTLSAATDARKSIAGYKADFQRKGELSKQQAEHKAKLLAERVNEREQAVRELAELKAVVGLYQQHALTCKLLDDKLTEAKLEDEKFYASLLKQAEDVIVKAEVIEQQPKVQPVMPVPVAAEAPSEPVQQLNFAEEFREAVVVDPPCELPELA